MRKQPRLYSEGWQRRGRRPTAGGRRPLGATPVDLAASRFEFDRRGTAGSSTSASAFPVGAARCARGRGVRYTVGNAVQLRHIGVDPLAGTEHVHDGESVRPWGVAVRELRAVVAAQDLMHRRCGDRDPAGDTQGPILWASRSGRTSTSTTRLVRRGLQCERLERSVTVCSSPWAVSAGPARGGGVSDLELLTGATQVPALVGGTLPQPQPQPQPDRSEAVGRLQWIARGPLRIRRCAVVIHTESVGLTPFHDH
ncbi:hypothetical protein Ae707Ps1_6089c [Pseudonocardia sp. Ae707_Ps1]|nr:hypothetical protein Ae707Ps1_6089c [Pseudonocardia sp. Ae707_Ps1]